MSKQGRGLWRGVCWSYISHGSVTSARGGGVIVSASSPSLFTSHPSDPHPHSPGPRNTIGQFDSPAACPCPNVVTMVEDIKM